MLASPAVAGFIAEKEKKQKPVSNVQALIDAKKCQITGNVDKAESLYRDYIEKYPQDPVAYYELAGILGSKNNLGESANLASKAVELDPDNVWYKLFLAEVYQIKGDYKEAISLYKLLLDGNPDNLDYLYQMAALNIASERFRDAVEIYDRIEKKTGVSEEISLQKEKLYLLLKDIPRALQELEQLVNAFPEEPKYLSILAEFYLANGQSAEALKTYLKILELDPDDPYIHMSLADYYRKQGNKEQAFEELKEGFANPNLDIDTKVTVLLSFYTLNELYTELKDKAFILANILLDVHPGNPKSHSIYGDLLIQDKKTGEAREEFLKAVTLDSSNYVIWEEVMRLDLQLEMYDHLASFSERAIELFPEQPIPFLFSGMAAFQQKRFEDALTAFDRGSKMVVSNDELLATFYMYMGDTYHSLNRIDESDKAYEKSLAIKYDNPYVLNNYAYYLSLRGKDLDKAEKMAKRAITLEPDNSSFQDTYGWVLYKQGRYEDAEPWIDRALDDKEGISAEVLEHYGDVMFKLGNVGKALEYWIKARDKGPGSALLEKKITDKMLYE
jgi:tetratricopeptide (TPR) repeat protein